MLLSLALSLSERTLTTSSLISSTLKKGNSINDSSILHTINDEAMAKATEIDDNRSKGIALPLLAGLPVSIKDNINVKGYNTTAGSHMLKDYISVYDATIVKSLKQNQCIPCFKTNMDEFGMGSSMLNSSFGPCPNPWTKPGNSSNKLTPGGSSGGSATVVGNGIVPVSIGSDTGGSIRLPASFCGLVGFKPTYGTLSRHGLISYASSMDTIGIITKSVIDSALVYDTIVSSDPQDPTSIASSSSSASEIILGSPIKDKTFTSDDISQMIKKSNNLISLKDVTIGIPKEFILDELNDDIRKAWQLAIDMFIDAGAKVVDVSLPLLRLAVPCYYILACAEASSNLSRYDGIRYGLRYDPDMAEKQEVEIGALHKLISKNRGLGFGPEVIKRILTGSYVLSESAYHQYYGNADRIRNGIRKEMRAMFSDNNIHMIACPTSPTLPYALNDPPDPCQMLLNDLFTVPANLTGSPAISIPISVSYSSKYDTNLPIGIQLMGPSLSETQLFQSALALEQRAQFNKNHTPEWLM